METAWTQLRSDDSIVKETQQWTLQGTVEDGNQRILGKRSGERNVDSRFYVQLEEDEGGSIR